MDPARQAAASSRRLVTNGRYAFNGRFTFFAEIINDSTSRREARPLLYRPP
jgi:hypothetical protein